MRIYLYYVGKPRDASANQMAEEYIRRSSRYGRCEMREIRPGRLDPWEKHPSATKILLDPAAKSLESGGFAKLIAGAERDARDLVFLVGGADGLPERPRASSTALLIAGQGRPSWMPLVNIRVNAFILTDHLCSQECKHGTHEMSACATCDRQN